MGGPCQGFGKLREVFCRERYSGTAGPQAILHAIPRANVANRPALIFGELDDYRFPAIARPTGDDGFAAHAATCSGQSLRHTISRGE